MHRSILTFLALLAPTQAFAFDFGFVRGPDWMDQYLIPLGIVAAVALVLTLLFKPRGVPANAMYQHFGEFSFVGRIVYAIFGLSFTVLMLMVFAGMGLVRAAEAGL